MLWIFTVLSMKWSAIPKLGEMEQTSPGLQVEDMQADFDKHDEVSSHPCPQV